MATEKTYPNAELLQRLDQEERFRLELKSRFASAAQFSSALTELIELEDTMLTGEEPEMVPMSDLTRDYLIQATNAPEEVQDILAAKWPFEPEMPLPTLQPLLTGNTVVRGHLSFGGIVTLMLDDKHTRELIATPWQDFAFNVPPLHRGQEVSLYATCLNKSHYLESSILMTVIVRDRTLADAVIAGDGTVTLSFDRPDKEEG